jgi:hypothetical protein
VAANVARVDTQLGSVRDRGRAALRRGLPASLIAVAALVVGVSILVEANNRDDHIPTFAEFTATKQACVLDRGRTRGFTDCLATGPNVYKLTSPRPLVGATAIVSRGSCCPGQASASITGPRTITVVLLKVRGPVRAQVIVP